MSEQDESLPADELFRQLKTLVDAHPSAKTLLPGYLALQAALLQEAQEISFVPEIDPLVKKWINIFDTEAEGIFSETVAGQADLRTGTLLYSGDPGRLDTYEIFASGLSSQFIQAMNLWLINHKVDTLLFPTPLPSTNFAEMELIKGARDSVGRYAPSSWIFRLPPAQASLFLDDVRATPDLLPELVTHYRQKSPVIHQEFIGRNTSLPSESLVLCPYPYPIPKDWGEQHQIARGIYKATPLDYKKE